MDKQIIHIFGAAGAGTTTLGKFLSEKTGFYHMDTDDYFWERTDPPYQVKRKAGERIARMEADIRNHDRVIISGSLIGWGDCLIPLFTLAIRVETDTATRLTRLKAREKAKLGSRIEAGGDMHTHHLEFLEWAACYDTGGPEMRSRQTHDAWQTQLTCNLLQLNGILPPAENYEIIKRFYDLP